MAAPIMRSVTAFRRSFTLQSYAKGENSTRAADLASDQDHHSMGVAEFALCELSDLCVFRCMSLPPHESGGGAVAESPPVGAELVDRVAAEFLHRGIGEHEGD